MNTSELGLGQTFAKVFSKVAVGRRKAKISKKVAKFFGGRAKVAGGGVEPRATILYGLENCSVSRLQKVPFPWKSRAARARKPKPYLTNHGFV